MKNGWIKNEYYKNGHWLGSYSPSYMTDKIAALWYRECKNTHPMWEQHVDSIEEAKTLIEQQTGINDRKD